jgi:hypothetical protein
MRNTLLALGRIVHRNALYSRNSFKFLVGFVVAGSSKREKIDKQRIAHSNFNIDPTKTSIRMKTCKVEEEVYSGSFVNRFRIRPRPRRSKASSDVLVPTFSFVVFNEASAQIVRIAGLTESNPVFGWTF